jgi:Na+-driven multidrug efflux pump/anti-sigma regulatory factor (Ser/Thr protein kinase)
LNDTRLTALTANDTLIKGLVYRYIAPSICALLGAQSSGVVISILVGRHFGSLGLSVVSITGPLNLLYLSLGSLIGVGSSVISSIALGRNEKSVCNQVYSLAWIVALGISLVLTVAGLLNLDGLVRLLGASGETLPYVKEFCTWYLASGWFTLLSYIPLNYLRIAGKPNAAMVSLLLLAAFTVAGIFLCVNVLDMGIGGMALAQGIGGLAALCYCMKALGFKRFKFVLPHNVYVNLREILPTGAASALNNLSRAGQNYFVNIYFGLMGAQAFIASFSIVNSISTFLLAFSLGIGQAALPLVGVSFGERDYRSIKIIMKKALFAGNIIMAIISLLVIALSAFMPALFGMTDAALSNETVIGLVIFAFSLNLGFVNNLFSSYFSATRRKALANIIVLLRLLLLVFIPCVLLFGTMGATALWYSFVIAEVLTLLIILGWTAVVRRHNTYLTPVFLLNIRLIEKIKTIDISVENNVDAISDAAIKTGSFCNENNIDTKTATKISHAIEEMLIMINKYSIKPGKKTFIDVRLSINAGQIIMRIRNAGTYFNPIEYYYNVKDTEEGFDETLGLAMIVKMADKIEYSEILGLNNLIVFVATKAAIGELK